ncbi:MAG TPA: hypothetical protein VL500_04525 [Candidatus Eisenbacteria bacterium]|nr:hypothetical protein [Candidatus Eisenbacteria bacterium]
MRANLRTSMQPELIARVISLIQKNGDKVVLADPQSGKAVVVMDLEAYEKLCVPAPALAPAPAPIEAPSRPFMMAPKIAIQEVEKKAEVSKISTKKKGIQVTPDTMGSTHILADLTQEELIDKINRDIGAWKTAQERRRTDELKSAAQPMPQYETVNALEEEERFYLEPIE